MLANAKARSLATPDRHPFIYFSRLGTQDTRTPDPLLFLLAISATDRQCDSVTVRQCDSATQRQSGGSCCPLPTAACEHHPQPTRLWFNPDRSMHRCMDGKWKLLHSSCTRTGRTEWRVRSGLHRSALYRHSFPNLNRFLIILRPIRTWPPHVILTSNFSIFPILSSL